MLGADDHFTLGLHVSGQHDYRKKNPSCTHAHGECIKSYENCHIRSVFSVCVQFFFDRSPQMLLSILNILAHCFLKLRTWIS